MIVCVAVHRNSTMTCSGSTLEFVNLDDWFNHFFLHYSFHYVIKLTNPVVDTRLVTTATKVLSRIEFIFSFILFQFNFS